MRTIFSIGMALAALIIVVPATADAAVNPGTCTTLSRDLTVGSSGTDVSNLQRYLVAQNYPGGGTWMVTGYYGEATRVAVRNFQISAGLSQSGVVDSATRSAIQQYSCGGSSYYNPYTNYSYDPYSSGIVLGASTSSYYDPYTGSYTYTPTYTPSYGSGYAGSTYCTYYNCAEQGITLSYISPNTAAVGAQVSVYGSGFSENNNTVHIGSGIVPFLRSSDGRSLSFTVPQSLTGYGNQPIQNQTYSLYVTNAFGQNSNQVNFTVGGAAGTGNQPFISNITGPTTVSAGQNNSWNVTVFGPRDSIVKVDVIWGDEYQGSSSSSAAQQSIFVGNSGTASLSFSHTYAVNGTYSPTFIASNGYGSNSRTQSVIVGTGGNVGSVLLNSLSPNSGQRGSQVILFGSGFTTTDNTIHFGFGGLRNVASVANGTALYFTVPHYISACDTVTGASCSQVPTAVTAGSYPIFVTNANGTTQTLNFSVTN